MTTKMKVYDSIRQDIEFDDTDFLLEKIHLTGFP